MANVMITEQENWAFNVLNTHLNAAKEELDRALAARNTYVGLLEVKYKAKFNPETGYLEAVESGDDGNKDTKIKDTKKVAGKDTEQKR